MATRVVSSTYQDFTQTQLLNYLNSETGVSYSDIESVVAGAGITLTSSLISKFAKKALAAKFAPILGGLGWGVVAASLYDLMVAEKLKNERDAVINEIIAKGGKMRIYTEYIEWSSGSGNHYTYYTRTRYSRVA